MCACVSLCVWCTTRGSVPSALMWNHCTLSTHEARRGPASYCDHSWYSTNCGSTVRARLCARAHARSFHRLFVYLTHLPPRPALSIGPFVVPCEPLFSLFPQSCLLVFYRSICIFSAPSLHESYIYMYISFFSLSLSPLSVRCSICFYIIIPRCWYSLVSPFPFPSKRNTGPDRD